MHFTFFNTSYVLVTDLTNTLTKTERELLSKGPKFAVNEAVNDTTRRNVSISFCRLANELRWKEHWKRQTDSKLFSKNNDNFIQYPYRDDITQAPKYPDFERKLYRINENITACLNSINRREANNLLPSERKTLNDLKKKKLYYLPIVW